MAKEIRLNAFHMNTPSHSWAGLWQHPRDRSLDYTTPGYWADLARTAERGLFDGVFLADVFGTYDVYGGSRDAAIATGAQSPSNDPFMVVPFMAQATSHIGFGITATLTYEQPYQFARRFSTLDHLTGGRIGWNIVTGYLKSAATGMGQSTVRSHDERYDAGDDFMAAVYKLWEGSWEPGAVLRDKALGRFTDPARVHTVSHHGPYYQVEAAHLSEPSPQRTPVLYQAGSSGRGRDFAARHAECVFLNGQTKAIVRDAVAAIRRRAVAFGRRAEDIVIFLGATVVIAPTAAEARDLAADYAAHIDPIGQLALVSGWSGIDFAKYRLDEAIRHEKSNSIQSFVENITTKAAAPITPRDLIGFNGIGARGPFVVGDPAAVADELLSWVDETGVDGFNLARLVVPESLNALVDLLVPELQNRGRFKTAYGEGPLRRKLFPGDGPHLPERHAGAAFRHR
ncbi:LLM class flavin-dependent oxidoreductase [Zavarzinia compransoris]|uniref:N5,N10-methylene tetrahydromethanopterin reductase n=1 Tax=Zavarzinia compransoris TaxID=1264899 RepID=A0A317DTV5_9PROT|nr:LLM class flavin-dependent oxidoreductase [Zavarzinia compransoris]PWR17804.1 N5,N10-methylene tetrahydromethanopterin reductase [Zavarzinia compransoris]TDP49337.1 FMN-dependent oxidoreductase (nitrilotriacetate monooxygenase family) [Zavarzinia compransoris]